MDNKNPKFNLEGRLIDFAVIILDLVEKLPNTYAGKHLGGATYKVRYFSRTQLRRSTSSRNLKRIFYIK